MRRARQLVSVLTLTLAIAPVIAPAGHGTEGGGEPSPDRAPNLLRGLQPLPPAAALPALHPPSGSPVAGNVLFYYTGDDNAACVRSLGDVTGDGRHETIVGYDIFKTGDNLYCLAGTSSGLATVVWSLETQGGASGGYFWGDQCLARGSDVTGDGRFEVLAGLAGGGRFAAAYDGSSGQLIWQYDTYAYPPSGWVYSIQEVGDVNGDAVPDVFFGTGSDNNSVHMIDGTSTGTTPLVLWSYSGPDVFYSVAGLGDVNGDAVPDVIAGSGDDYPGIYAFDGTNGSVLWSHALAGGAWHVNSIEDLNGNGSREALVASWGTPEVECFDGATGSSLFSSNIPSYAMRAEPIEDVDGDGLEDVLIASWENALRCVSSATGALIWLARAGSENGGDVWTCATIDDVDRDCHDDVLFGSFDGKIYCVDGTGGTELWSHDTNNRIYSVASIGDLNGDGTCEAIAGTQDTTSTTVVYAIEGDSGLEGATTLRLIGDPHIGATVTLRLRGTPSAQAVFLWALADGCLASPFGTLQLDPATLGILLAATIPPTATLDLTGTIPDDPVFVGLTPHIQAVVIVSTQPKVGDSSNRVRFTVLP
ncbi:MAG: PQQ-binding-like beta-propeller repeat protein [Planctomycetota bacterium]